MDDKRSIDVFAPNMDSLKQALEAVHGWEVKDGSTKDFPVGMWRDDDFINFRVQVTEYGVEAHSVNIMPQDYTGTPERIAEDEIYKVYETLKQLPEDMGVGVTFNPSEQDVEKLSKM